MTDLICSGCKQPGAPTDGALCAVCKVDRAVYYIMYSPLWVAYAGVIMVGTITVVDEPITAYTNGFDVRYGRAFIDSLTDQQVRFVVLHENLHKMFRHLFIWTRLFEQDMVRANCACDYVINLIIKEVGDPGVYILSGCLLDEKYKGLDSGQVFDRLPPTPPCPFCQAGIDHESMPGAGGTCEHPNSFDQHDWKAAKDFSKEERAKQGEELDQAIRQGAVLASRAAGNKPRAFDEFMAVPIDWREVMRQFISAHCKGRDYATFRRPNRRFLQYDMIMPSMISETIDSIAFCIDTSGSIQGEALNKFVSAGITCVEQVNPARIDLIYWDHVVAAHEVYFQGDAQKIRSSTRPAGGGGTSPSCITKYMAKNNIKPTCAVVLTDGFTGGDWGGEWPCPVLWVIKDNPAAHPTTGSAVHF